MKPLRLLIVVLMLPLLGGCYGVYSTRAVGERPLVIDPEAWEGTWVHKDGAVTVAVTNPERGLLQLGWAEKKQGKLVFENYHVELRQTGQWIFGNVRDPGRPKLYAWARVVIDGNQIVLWVPDRARFEDMVRDNSIEGRVEKKGEDVILTGYGPEAVKRLMTSDGGIPLEYERPLVFHRLSR